MQRKQIVQLLEKYAFETHKSINHFELIEQKLKYEEEFKDEFKYFWDSFLDISEFLDFHFDLKVDNPENFEQFLAHADFPIIAFSANSNKLIPVILKPKKKGKFDIIEFNGSDEMLCISDLSGTDVLNKLKSIGKLKAENSFQPFAEKLKVEDSAIVFLTGLPLSNQYFDNQTHAAPLSPRKRFLALLKEERKDIYTLYFFAIMIALVNLSLPLGIQAIVGLMSGGLLIESVFVLMLMVIVATMIAGWLQIKQLGIVEVLQQRFFAKTAFDFAHRIPRLKIENLGNHYMPELINRFFDVLNVQKSLPKILIDFATAIVQIIFGLLLLSFYHTYFILFGLIVLAVIFLVFYITGKKGLETSIYESKYKYKVVYWLEELGRSIQSFKLAGDARLAMHKTDRLLDKYILYRRAHFKILVSQYTAIISFKTIITAGLLILGGALVFNEQINLGQFIASEIIIVLVISSVEKLIGSISVVYDLLTALDKIGHVTDLKKEANQGRNVADLGIDTQFKLELINLGYQYKEASLSSFHKVSFTIHSGEKICLAGFNDAGKTTLVKTIAGLFHDYQGVIKLNGMSIRELNINSYRQIIGDNLSLTDVFEGTIEENITMGREGIVLQEILGAVKLAGLDSFVSSLKSGLQTEVQPSGANLPSNVVKKILLARSFVTKPKLIIIDEFFHNVQSTEKLQLLDTLFAGEYALIIVSSIPEVMRRCDKIYVMKNGSISDQGNFLELDERKALPLI